MKLEQAAIVLRPRGLLGSSDLAFRFIFSIRRGLWLGLFLLVFLPATAVTAALRYVFEWHWGYLWLLLIAYGSIAQGVFSTAAGLLMFEKNTRLRSILSQYFRHFFVYSSVIGFSRIISIVLLPVSGLGAFTWVRWAFAHEAVLLEQAPLNRALKRSADFVKGHLEDGLLLLGLLTGLNALLPLCFEALGHGVEELLMLPVQLESLFETGGSLYAAIGYFASLPFCAVLRFLAYVDGRTRRDGWDIQVRFMALAAEAEAEQSRTLKPEQPGAAA